MKVRNLKLLALSIFIFCFTIFHSQSTLSKQEKKSIQRSSKWILHKHAKFPTTLAAKLTKDLEDEESKVYAITYWIAKNIKYDYSAFLSNTLSRHTSKEILKKRRALCSEYAELFNEMCEAVGLKSETINGYVREFDFFAGDTLYRAEHAWSTVKIDNKWELMDITWGAGQIEPKKQLLKKALWVLFEKPYEVEFHYVHKYNPNWFHVDPSIMVSSHLPTFDFFQFLKKPVTIKEFELGKNYVVDRSSDLMVDKSTNYPLKEYLAMGKRNRLELENTISKKNAPENNRLLGFNNFLLFESLYSEYYNPEKKQLIASSNIRGKMNSYRDLAIENLKKSIDNNNQEFSHYESRSLAWLDTLSLVNKRLNKKIKNRIKENNQQISSAKKIDRTATSYQKSTNKSKSKFDKFTLANNKRPTPKKHNLGLAKAYLNFEDSLERELRRNEKNIDSIFLIYNIDKQSVFSSSEKEVTDIHASNKKELNKFILQKKLDYAFIYFNQEMVNKSALNRRFDNANSINHDNLAILLKDLNSYLKVLKTKIKMDKKNTSKALKALKSAKKNSYIDLNESNEAEYLIENYKRRMKKYNEDFRKYFNIKTKVEWWLKLSKKNLKKTYKNLVTDIKLEKQRHKNYMSYRKSIQNSENSNMKLLLKKLDKMGRYFIKEKQVLANQKLLDRNHLIYSNSYYSYGKPTGDEDVPSSSLVQESKFFNTLNKARKEMGMNELEIDWDLFRAARYHSYDMGTDNYFEHASYDRSDLTGHLERVCGTFSRINCFGKAYGENIAAGNSDGEKTYIQWFNSPGHYKIMFNPKFKTIGVGYVKTEGSSYTHYWTADFGY